MVRVYLRVSYGMVVFRVFYGSELFYALGWLVWLTVV